MNAYLGIYVRELILIWWDPASNSIQLYTVVIADRAVTAVRIGTLHTAPANTLSGS